MRRSAQHEGTPVSANGRSEHEGTPSSAPGSPSAIVNALTIDVEDYFQVSAFAPHIAAASGTRCLAGSSATSTASCRCSPTRHAHATFFTLGWIAERYPELVRRIVQRRPRAGEPRFRPPSRDGSAREEFLADIRLAKAVLEDISGSAVHGYRAPSFSIGPTIRGRSSASARQVTATVRASIRSATTTTACPTRRAFRTRVPGGLLELPVTTVRLMSRNWPAGGGGYFRLLPYVVSRWLMRRINAVDGQPAIFYFHPWELDPDQPRVSGPGLKTRFRHYVNLRRTQPRLRRLLRDLRWESRRSRVRERGRVMDVEDATAVRPVATTGALLVRPYQARRCCAMGRVRRASVRTRRSSIASAGAALSRIGVSSPHPLSRRDPGRAHRPG